VVDGDPNWSTDPNEYPLEMPGRGTQATSPNSNEVVAFACQMRVRGIPVLADEPIQEIYEIATILIAASNLTGSAFQLSTLT